MANRVQDKIALITGAAGGLGSAIAQALAREGALVVLTDRDADAAGQVAERINTGMGKPIAWAARLDVTSEADWQAVLAQVDERHGGLSVLVNNAGMVVMGSVEDLSLDQWRLGMAVNVDSAFLGIKYALPLLRKRQPGSIVNIASISALIASHAFANYNASKAAMWMLTKSVALHCARGGWDIRCNSVHPSFIDTGLLDELSSDQALRAKLAKQVPIGRIGEPEEVAAAVLYLASDESRFMTGAELKLDGGISAM
jgi:NAD(P)-dependent dehydrogenase (short-subunit alcohol dehydrogenase family)